MVITYRHHPSQDIMFHFTHFLLSCTCWFRCQHLFYFNKRKLSNADIADMHYKLQSLSMFSQYATLLHYFSLYFIQKFVYCLFTAYVFSLLLCTAPLLCRQKQRMSHILWPRLDQIFVYTWPDDLWDNSLLHIRII